mgnify:FL=1
MRITKTEIKNRIEGKDPIATYYGGLAGLGLEIYEIDESEEIVYFVEVAGVKETPKKSKIIINNNGRCGFRWGHQTVWLDECMRTNW